MEYVDRIICGNSGDVAKELPDECVQTIFTSPPYYGLRKYEGEATIWENTSGCQHDWKEGGTAPTKIAQHESTETEKHPSLVENQKELACDHEWGEESIVKTSDNYNKGFNERYGHSAGQKKQEHMNYGQINQGAFCIKCGAWYGMLGLEPAPELYISHLVSIFREYRRVLRTDGTLFVNIGDSYAGSWKGASLNTDSQLENYVCRPGGLQYNMPKTPGSLKPKDLIGIPWMLALALRDDGWWLRSTIVWKKRNCMPSSAEDRPTTDFEYIFLLAKNGAKPSFWTHRDGYGSRTKPEADYRWKDMLVGGEQVVEPEGDWRTEVYVGPPTAGKEKELDQSDSVVETTHKRWKRYNLWKGHAYYYNAEAIKEPNSPTTGRWGDYGGSKTAQAQKGPHGETSALTKSRSKADFLEKYYENGRNKRTVWNEGETYQNVWNLIGAFQEAGASDEMVEKATAIFGEGSDSSIIDIPTKGFSGAHFAVFPPALARVIILAGSSDTACPICGAAWFPRKEKVGEFQRRFGTGNAEGSPYRTQSSMQAIWEDKGLQPTCVCEGNDGSGASLVADIFSGAGTLCMVAKQKGRHWLGIEAAQKYVEMSENRIAEAEVEIDPDRDQLKLSL